MTPPTQFTFIYGLPTGRSRRAHELQLSKARSHAATIAHQRLKPRNNFKIDYLEQQEGDVEHCIATGTATASFKHSDSTTQHSSGSSQHYSGPETLHSNSTRKRYDQRPGYSGSAPAIFRVPSPIIRNGEFTMDNSKMRVFQYFMHHWMPSLKSLPHGCQITGFTPVHAGDLELSNELLREAFHSQHSVSLYSILTVCARRMRAVDGISWGFDLPEVYAAKAIATLRELVESKCPVSSRLILDISYLVLSEVFVISPQKPETYGSMIRDIIIMYGGLHKIRPFTAQACLGWDNLMAATTLSLPALDPYQSPELLLKPSMISKLNASELNFEMFLRVQQLEDRPRIFAIESHSFTMVIQALQGLPNIAREGIRDLVAECGPRIYKILIAPFIPTGNSSVHPHDKSSVAVADCEYMHLKINIYLIWVWQTALGYLGSDAAEYIALSPCLVDQIPTLLERIRTILTILDTSDWSMEDGVLIWLAAVALLSSTSECERNSAILLLDTAIWKASISTEYELNQRLGAYPPLGPMLLQHQEVSLWRSIQEHRWRHSPYTKR